MVHADRTALHIHKRVFCLFSSHAFNLLMGCWPVGQIEFFNIHLPLETIPANAQSAWQVSAE